MATLSLGSPCLLSFRPQLKTEEVGILDGSPSLCLMLPRRSLVVFTSDAYTTHMHSISAAPVEVVPKTLLGSAGNGNGADGSASEAGASSSGSGGGEGGVAGGGGPQHPGPIANASEAGVTPGDVVVRLKRVSLTFRKVKDGSND